MKASWADIQTLVAQRVSLILPNEFLFCIFYLLQEWGQPITSKKLAKDLGAKEKIVRDHLNLLLKLGVATKTGEKYRLTEMGKEAAQFITVAAGKTQFETLWLSNSDLPSEAVLSISAANPDINSAGAQAGLTVETSKPLGEDEALDPGESATITPYQPAAENAA